VKIAAIILCGLSLPLTVSAQEVRSSPCNTIAQDDALLSQHHKELAALLVNFTDKHPRVISLKETIAKLEADRAAAVAQAASQGVVCSENAPPQAKSQTPPPNVR
jgi:hypothetical protein